MLDEAAFVNQEPLRFVLPQWEEQAGLVYGGQGHGSPGWALPHPCLLMGFSPFFRDQLRCHLFLGTLANFQSKVIFFYSQTWFLICATCVPGIQLA